MEKLIVIDGNSLVNRAYYALPPLNNPAGEPVQAVYGFATMLIKAIEDIKPDYIAVAFDLRAPTFRHKQYSGYKATRKGMPDELASQMPILKNMLKIMGIKCLESEGFEADDIIGTMSKRNKVMTYIITGDRDSLQLIDESTTVLLTKRGLTDIQAVDEQELKAAFKLTPSQVIEYKALAGDSSDNIPGVTGIGDKTAMNLLEKYDNIDNLYAHIDEITGAVQTKLINGKENAYLSKMLATIKTDMTLDCEIGQCTYIYPFDLKVRAFFEQMNFKSLLKRTDIFSTGASALPQQVKKPAATVKVVKSLEELTSLLENLTFKRIAFNYGESVSFAFDDVNEYIININYSFFDEGLDVYKVLTAFKPVLENPDIIKILYDAKHCKKVLKHDFKIVLNGYEDIKLAQYLTDMAANYSSIAALIKTYEIDDNEIATGINYIWNELKKSLKELNMEELYYNMELPLIEVLFSMEELGFKLDLKKLNELGEKYTSEQTILEKQITDMAGHPFNVRSPKQLAVVLFEELKIPYPKKGTNYSTGAEILEPLEVDYPIATLVLKYRFVAKLNSTYIEGLRKLVDKNGMVHTEFRQTLTTTGRLSSVEPNLQNIPVREEEGKALRGLFIASPDHTLIAADYSQIELRLMAHMADDELMKKAYLSNEDIHTATAALVFGVDASDVTPKMRREAKAVNFGIIYGISDFGLATNLKISRSAAKKYIENYFEKFSGVKKYLEDSVVVAKKTGSVSTLFGRVRKIPELFSSSYNTRQFGERAAMNMPLQGSAADIIKIAMINVYNALKPLKSKLILQIHDELIVDAAIDEIKQVKSILKDCMESAVKLSIPLTVEIGEGNSWLEC